MNFHPVLRFLSPVYFILVDYFFKIKKYFFSEKVSLFRTEDPLLNSSATALAKSIRNGEITSESLVLTFRRRAKEINPLLNAIVEWNPLAIEEARKVDELIKTLSHSQLEEIARNRPFFGVPFTAKECIEVEGLPCTYGVKARAGRISQTTAPVVQNLINAGMILIGKTNVPELCLAFYTESTVYEQCRNPYDLRRTSGGSSGGEGAMIAAGGSVVGVGSDIAGSIRFPAAFNGIFGLKTTHGLINPAGHLPPLNGFRSTMLSIGPMARYAEDLEGMLRIMINENIDKISLGQPIKKIRLFYIEDLGSALVQPCCTQTLATLRRAVSSLEERFGVDAHKIEFDLSQAVELIGASMQSTPKDIPVRRLLTDDIGEISTPKEMAKFLIGLESDYTFSPLFVGLMEEWNKHIFTLLGDSKNEKFLGKRDELIGQFRELLGDDGFIVCPTFPTIAPFHGQGACTIFNFAYCGLWNIMGLPAVQCPVGMSEEGMPLGVQIIGPRYSDGALIEIAKEMERMFGGWHMNADEGELEK